MCGAAPRPGIRRTYALASEGAGCAVRCWRRHPGHCSWSYYWCWRTQVRVLQGHGHHLLRRLCVIQMLRSLSSALVTSPAPSAASLPARVERARVLLLHLLVLRHRRRRPRRRRRRQLHLAHHHRLGKSLTATRYPRLGPDVCQGSIPRLSVQWGTVYMYACRTALVTTRHARPLRAARAIQSVQSLQPVLSHRSTARSDVVVRCVTTIFIIRSDITALVAIVVGLANAPARPRC